MDESEGDKVAKSVLEELSKALSGEASRRSRLDRWMTTNYDGFAELIEAYGTNWAKLTETFEALGFGEDGKPLGKETVRQTWYRVRQRHARRSGRVVDKDLSADADPVQELSELPHRSAPAFPASQKMPAPAPAQGETSLRQAALDGGLADVIAEMNKRSGR